MVSRSLVYLSFSVVALVGSVQRVAAGGPEYAGGGVQALGRGGAVSARADDAMVLLYNPAGLAELRGSSLLFDANLALMDACVEPLGYYGWGVYNGGSPFRLTDAETGQTQTLSLGEADLAGPAEDAYYNGQLDTVCMEQNLTPIPQFGVTMRVSDDLGIGFGLMFPAAVPQGRWGGENGVIRNAAGELRPAPTRYMVLGSSVLGLFPTFGAGYRLTDWLRIGAAFEWGIITVSNTSMGVPSGGTSPAQDIVNRVDGVDWFVPAFNASIHLVPFDNLDIVAAFRYQADLHAAGTITMTTGLFDPTAVPHVNQDLEITDIEQKMPWKLNVGVRYADRLTPRPTGTGNDDLRGGGRLLDAFETERWDLEVDLEYQMTGRNQDQIITYRPGQELVFESLDGMMLATPFPEPNDPNTEIEKRWKNQISVRAGGSYNIVPGFFGISAGFHYETRGLDPNYMQLDFWPLSRIGLHTGVRFRVSRTIDLAFSYAHIFQETLTVGAPEHEPVAVIDEKFRTTGELTTIDKSVGLFMRGKPREPLEEKAPASVDGVARLDQNRTKLNNGEPPYLINSGSYISSFDVFAIGMHIHF